MILSLQKAWRTVAQYHLKKNNHKKVALVMMTSVFARSYSQLSLHPSSHLCCLHHYRMYCNCTGPGFALHSDIVMPYIVNYGSKEQIKHFIPKMTAGKCIAAIAMTEPGAGRSGLKHKYNIKKSAHIMSGSFSN